MQKTVSAFDQQLPEGTERETDTKQEKLLDRGNITGVVRPTI